MIRNHLPKVPSKFCGALHVILFANRKDREIVQEKFRSISAHKFVSTAAPEAWLLLLKTPVKHARKRAHGSEAQHRNASYHLEQFDDPGFLLTLSISLNLHNMSEKSSKRPSADSEIWQMLPVSHRNYMTNVCDISTKCRAIS